MTEPTAPDVARLTDAQRAIVRLLAQGWEPKEIAAMRGTTHITVKNHIWLAKERSGARTTWQLVALVACDPLRVVKDDAGEQ